ncbi:hypothetical protein V2J09_020103 [Rumex salicifolius]
MAATGSPCGACKFLRRKCASDCVFAPYFCSEQGPARFAAVHKVFGASNVAKLLLHLPAHDRCEAVLTIAYEAQARVRDPVYGCVAHIFALQQQVQDDGKVYFFSFDLIIFADFVCGCVAYLQGQLMQVKAQLASNLVNNSRASNHLENNQFHLLGNNNNNNNNNLSSIQLLGNYQVNCFNPISPQSSLESIEQASSYGSLEVKLEQNSQVFARDDQFFLQHYQPCGRKRPHDDDDDDMSELQELAYRMMRN